MAYDFSLDRKAAVTLGAGSVLLLFLMFAAGVLTGVTWQNEQQMIAARRPAVSLPKVVAAAAPGAPPRDKESKGRVPATASTQDASTTAGAEPEAATAAASAPAPPAPAASEPDAKATTTAAPAGTAAEPPARVPAYSGTQLAVQVGAFLEKSNAEKLAEELKAEGYAPQIIVGGHAPRQWNIVRIGPYRDWDEASEIAAVLSRDRSTPAVIRPIR
jgi:cell division protein FtsN